MTDMKRKKVVFFIASLSGGGAERALLHVLRNLDRTKYQPSLLLLNRVGALLSEVPSDVTIHELGKTSRWDFLTLPGKIYRFVKSTQPDVLVSYLTYCNVLALISKIGFRLRPPVIVVEQNHLSSVLAWSSHRFLRRIAVKMTYPFADQIVGCTQGCVDDLVDNFGVKRSIMTRIYNPADVAYCLNRSKEPIEFPPIMENGKPNILAAGRLTKQKDYPNLLRAFRLLVNEIPANLVILGEGSLLEELNDLARQLNISENVCFAGYRPNSYPFFVKSDCFVLSSIFEGFPMVVLEAMALGAPVISTDCPGGPNEAIENDVSGFLVPVGDPAALAEKIKILLSDKDLGARFIPKALEKTADFGIAKCVREFAQVIDELL